jgi:hypothetical protein
MTEITRRQVLALPATLGWTGVATAANEAGPKTRRCPESC